ncbi:MAG: phenylalanine--tRNA ligase subunit alpha, partial [Desulfobacteraceae bacterium]|nr:phenylalanine--tRNA ligase subunit alpha [Desulfobacteraceae bacterium]
MENRIEQIEAEALASLSNASDMEQIKSLSVKYLGRKGLVTLFLRNISELPVEERQDDGFQSKS